MTVSKALDFYQQQAATLNTIDRAVQQVTTVIEQMEEVLTRVVTRMEDLLSVTSKTSNVTNRLKSPLDSMVKTMGSKAQEGVDKLKTVIDPRNLALSFGINLAWNLFGDDILTLLDPTMKVLEGFAGVVHGIFEGLAPVFQPLTWPLSFLADMLGLLTDHAGMLSPVVLGLAVALTILKMNTIAAAIATGLKAAKDFLAAAASKAMEWATKGLNTSLLSSPLFWVAAVIGVVVGAIYGWVQSVGGLEMAWAIVVDTVLSKAEQFKVGFFSVFYGIQDMVGDFKVEVLMILQSMLNVAVGLINDLIGLFNQVTGATIPIVGEVTWGADAEAEHIAAKQERARNLTQMQNQADARHRERQMTMAGMRYNAAQTATDPGMSMAASENLFAAYAPATFAQPEMDTLYESSEVRNEVYLSEKNMQTMQNMAQAHHTQPVVHQEATVVVNATVNNQIDVKTMADAIARELDNEAAAGAERAYG